MGQDADGKKQDVMSMTETDKHKKLKLLGRVLLKDRGYLEDKDELQTKWFCVGRLINKPENPNKHDKFNEIRMCLHGSDGFQLWEWTPFEAARVGLGLAFAVSDFLVEAQPTREEG